MQNKVKIFNDSRNIQLKPMPVSARLLDIQSEMGELAKEYLKSTKYGMKNFDLTKDFELEFGDALYSLLSLANELNINAEKCLDLVIKKYQDRLNNKKDMGSSN